MLRDERVQQLARMPKRSLVEIWRATAGRDVIWTAHPVERWNREELIADILRSEGLA